MITDQDIFVSKILIIDDELANIKLLKKTLEQEGFSNLECLQDPRKVIDVFNEFMPQLILLDLRMPHLDGFGVMEKLSQLDQNAHAPIMVLTAEDESHIRLRALNSGAVDFLSKPFDYSEVILRIKNILKLSLISESHHTTPPNEAESSARKISKQTHNPDIDIIQSLCRANRKKFKQSGDNLIRVSHYAFLLGKALGLSEQQCEDLKYASSTYDIGKIGIPQSLLQRENDLGSEEIDLFKTHTTVGAELLSGSDTELMKLARRIAREHHENWDGTGYPDGMRASEICLEARIVAVCDGFESFTSKRPYQEPRSAEEGMAFLEENSGTLFEPKLIEKFKSILPLVKKFQDEFESQEGFYFFDLDKDYEFDSQAISKLKTALPNILSPSKQRKVLLVDDISTMRVAYKLVCKQVGFQHENIFEAPEGRGALNFLNRHLIDLVITDLYMPKMSGLELIDEIRKIPKHKELPIIVVSEENRKEIIMDILQKGANQYLLKPFNSYQLEEKINQIIFTKSV